MIETFKRLLHGPENVHLFLKDTSQLSCSEGGQLFHLHTIFEPFSKFGATNGERYQMRTEKVQRQVHRIHFFIYAISLYQTKLALSAAIHSLVWLVSYDDLPT